MFRWRAPESRRCRYPWHGATEPGRLRCWADSVRAASAAGPDARIAGPMPAATARVDRVAPARWPAAGRLPHAVARLRARPGRPARVPAPRRRAPHRLERHRAPDSTPHVREFTEDRELAAWFLLDLSPSVDFGSTPAPSARVSEASSSACWRACSRATATASARCCTATRGGHRDAGARRPHARAAPDADACAAARLHANAANGATQLADLLKAASAHRSSASAARCSWSPTSSASPAGSRPLGELARNATTWWPCACTTRSR